MKDILYRFWNTIKIPLVLLVISVIPLVVEELQKVGDFSTIFTWSFWEGTVYVLVIMTLPAIGASLDKWLREQGVYIERVFSKFRLPE